ncbi:conserved hypothetical protein [Coccidioides posadasii str. Silveira]|uniref:Uncharacterized protein n=1 Tax=Coccidioides posadasii (strain RMSCC 757 / Silveira) TaxID=443226 RepID=E9D9F4_COCPS|nr:conserved hypothetical protein [Coccidioides posadasii str. Silveira]
MPTDLVSGQSHRVAGSTCGYRPGERVENGTPSLARSLAAQRMQPRLTTTKLGNSCINDAFRLDHNCAGANHVAWWVDGRGKIQLANRHAGAA